MAESGRVPPKLRLCRGCRRFVRGEETTCPFCAADIAALAAEHEEALAEMRRAADALRAALARHGRGAVGPDDDAAPPAP